MRGKAKNKIQQNLEELQEGSHRLCDDECQSNISQLRFEDQEGGHIERVLVVQNNIGSVMPQNRQALETDSDEQDDKHLDTATSIQQLPSNRHTTYLFHDTSYQIYGCAIGFIYLCFPLAQLILRGQAQDDNNWCTQQILNLRYTEAAMLVLILMDLIFKLHNQRQYVNQNQINLVKMKLAFPDSIIYVDVFLSCFAVIFFLLEILLPNLQAVWAGALIGMRVFLKLFFSISFLIYQREIKFCWEIVKLINHKQYLSENYKINSDSNKSNDLFENPSEIQFSSYKEKVIFILKSIRKKVEFLDSLSEVNFDLQWCIFIVENDYLKISNSISVDPHKNNQSVHLPRVSNTSTESATKMKQNQKKVSRRFSKTVTQSSQIKCDSKIGRLNQLTNELLTQGFNDNNNKFIDIRQYFLEPGYNAYLVDSQLKGNLLYFTLNYLLDVYKWDQVFQWFPKQKFQTLCFQLQKAYRDNIYHSQVHAADVVNYLYQVLAQGSQVTFKCNLTDFDNLIIFLAGAAHDMDHPGTNNMFEIKTQSKLSILYNDQSVLEMHHAASFFFLLENPLHNCNIFQNLEPSQQLNARSMILEFILGTDMSKHVEIQTSIKNLIALDQSEQDLNGKNKRLIMKALVHAADISNPTRTFDIAYLWAKKVVQEFFDQGDKERTIGLEISMLCDRNTTNFAKSQIGFIQFVIEPYFNILSQLFSNMTELRENSAKNIDSYKLLVDEYEDKMKEGNMEF